MGFSELKQEDVEKKITKEEAKKRTKGSSKSRFNSIGTKVSLIMISTLLISIAVVGFINYNNSYNALKAELVSTCTQSADIVNFSIDNYLNGMGRQTKSVSYSDTILEVHENPDDEDYVNKLLDELSNVSESNPDVLSLYLGTNDKRMIIYPLADLGDDYDPTSRTWYKGALDKSGEINWSEPYTDAVTGNMIITVSTTVEDKGEVIGVVGMDIDIQDLSTYMASTKIGADGYVVVIDKTGIAIVHPDSEIVGTDSITNSSFWENAAGLNSGFIEHEFGGENKLTAFVKNAQTDWIIATSIPETELIEGTQALLYSTGIIIGIALIITIIISIVFSRFISTNTNKLVSGLKNAAEGDFTIHMDIKSKDEFGQVSDNFNMMIDRISDLLKKVKISSETVASTSSSILDMTKETDSAMNEVSQTIQEVARGSQEQAMEIDKNSNSINDLANSLENVYSAILEANELAGDTEGLGNKGLGEVEILIDRTEKTSSESDNLSNIINDVKESSNEINSITEAITQIAEQTNLLALNAAIEAARAGEAGRGFSVVAEEIRKLAEESSEATNHISDLILKMNKRTDDAVEAMKISKEAVDEQIVSVDSTKKIFDEIINNVNELDDKILQIKNTTAGIDSNKNSIVESTQNISAVSEEISASTQEVSASTEEVTAITHTFVEHSENLKRLSEELIKLVNIFRV